MRNEKCTRCGREVSFVHGEEFDDGFVCQECLTPAELQAVNAANADFMVLDSALTEAGLAGDDVDLETMTEVEYEMREELTEVLYQQDPGRRA